ncbi:hypothetical protein CLOP_g11273 [Closterium sp. NIES-67]|nr:hypothetical protein CLOP_g11273 [Closterium sp. NIES-67]
MQKRDACKWIRRWVGLSISIIVMALPMALPLNSEAFPIFAQQNYESPREATGRIVCANCHLAKNRWISKCHKQFFPILFLKQ